jgi:hypothetical protein
MVRKWSKHRVQLDTRKCTYSASNAKVGKQKSDWAWNRDQTKMDNMIKLVTTKKSSKHFFEPLIILFWTPLPRKKCDKKDNLGILAFSLFCKKKEKE